MTRDLSGPPEEETGGRLTIDLDALKSNWRLLDARAGRAECAAVVKGDAYGIGIEPAGRALWEAGARTFFVAHPFEARTLRAELPDAVIYVLNGLVARRRAGIGRRSARGPSSAACRRSTNGRRSPSGTAFRARRRSTWIPA